MQFAFKSLLLKSRFNTLQIAVYHRLYKGVDSRGGESFILPHKGEDLSGG